MGRCRRLRQLSGRHGMGRGDACHQGRRGAGVTCDGGAYGVRGGGGAGGGGYGVGAGLSGAGSGGAVAVSLAAAAAAASPPRGSQGAMNITIESARGGRGRECCGRNSGGDGWAACRSVGVRERAVSSNRAGVEYSCSTLVLRGLVLLPSASLSYLITPKLPPCQRPPVAAPARRAPPPVPPRRLLWTGLPHARHPPGMGTAAG